ncbi:MAG: NADH-quinone oxidoreductase subunit C [Acidobacteriota bacterium]|nr:NADH-quinone oxidoreductase subunit C [Acidobacteriota bacterium]
MSDKEANGSSTDESAAKADAAAAKAKADAAAAAKARKAAEEAAKPPWERDAKAPEPSDAAADPLVAALRSAHGEAIVSAVLTGEDLTIEVGLVRVRDVCTELKDAHGFHLLVDICGADYPDREEARFEVVYHLYSVDQNRRVRLKVRVPEDAEVPSVTSVWRGANWCEREIYDMYGVGFADHPDMTRILMWEGFHGHPLRKDFPVEGVDTGAAIYPEYYRDESGPVASDGTGWKPAKAPESQPETEPS